MYLIAWMTLFYALVTWWIHTFIGHRRVHQPVQMSNASSFSRSTSWVCWHMITWVLMLMAVGLACAAWGLWFRNQALTLAFVLSLPFALVFMVAGKRFRQSWLAMPQIFLLGPIAAGTAMDYALPLKIATHTAVAVAIGLVLLTLAAMHAYWAAGGSWPAKNRAALTECVVGQPSSHGFPGTLATWMVALALLAMAVLAWLPRDWSGVGVGSYLVAGVFALRGFGGFFEPLIRPITRQLPYGFYNKILYSPLCVGMAALWCWLAWAP